METATATVIRRPRAFVRVEGPAAAEYLERMLSNEIAALATGETCDALLLTPKGRVVAPLRVRRDDDSSFLLATEPELGDAVLAQLVRARFAARCEIAVEQREGWVVLGPRPREDAVPTGAYGVEAWEVWGGKLPPGDQGAADELERLRIAAGTPAWGREIDDRILPAEAGLDRTHVSFTKGCYPGQEPLARLHYRGKPNRRLARLAIDATETPPYDAEIRARDRVVGRVTSAVTLADGAVAALGYLRTDVEPGADLRVGDAAVRPLD